MTLRGLPLMLQATLFDGLAFDLVRGRRTRRITSQALLPRLEKVLRLAIIQVLDNPLAPTELGDTVLAAQSFQHDADLVFGRKVSPRRSTDVLHHLCRRFLHRPGFLS